MNILQLWNEMGIPVKGVVLVLTVQAILCIGVVVDRWRMLRRAQQESKAFAKQIGAALSASDWATLQTTATSSKGVLAEMFCSGLEVYNERRLMGEGIIRSAGFAERAMQRKNDSISERLYAGLNILASTGSTAPFIGLLGTVLGIINAFQLIAKSGSGGIGTIGAAIGESLIVTGYGLLVAIPTVLLFNWISTKISKLEGSLQSAASELSDRLQTPETQSSEAVVVGHVKAETQATQAAQATQGTQALHA